VNQEIGGEGYGLVSWNAKALLNELRRHGEIRPARAVCGIVLETVFGRKVDAPYAIQRKRRASEAAHFQRDRGESRRSKMNLPERRRRRMRGADADAYAERQEHGKARQLPFSHALFLLASLRPPSAAISLKKTRKPASFLSKLGS